MNTNPLKRIISGVLVVGIAGTVLTVLLRRMTADWPAIASYPWKMSWVLLMLSLIISMLASVLAIKAAHTLSEALGEKTLFPRFLYIFCITQVGRYLPGKIWHLVSFTMLLEREKVRRSVAIILPLLYQGTMVAVFLLIGALFSGPIVLSKLTPDFLWPAILFTGLIVLILLFLPFLTRVLTNTIARTFRPIKEFYLPHAGYISALSVLALSGLSFCCAFPLFLAGLIDVSIRDAPFIGGSFLLSCVIGWIIFIVPGGLGIREGALALLLSAMLSPALSTAVALAARVWMTAAEGLLLLAVWIWVRHVKGEKFSFNLQSNASGSTE